MQTKNDAKKVWIIPAGTHCSGGGSEEQMKKWFAIWSGIMIETIEYPAFNGKRYKLSGAAKADWKKLVGTEPFIYDDEMTLPTPADFLRKRVIEYYKK